MGFGGGGGTTSTSYTSTLPEYAQVPYEDLLLPAAERAFLQTPYQPYGGEKVAGPSWQELSARGGMQDMYLNPNMQFENYSRNMMNRASNIPGQVQQIGSSYDPTGFNAGRFGADQANFYMNPYSEHVTAKALRGAEDRYQSERDARAARSSGMGGRGGYRDTMMDALGQSEHQKNIGDIIAEGGNQSWMDAQAQFERDRSAQMGAWDIGQRNLGMRGQQDIESGMANNQTMLDIMRQQGQLGLMGMDIGNQSQANEIERMKMMQMAGADARADMQQQYNVGIQDHYERIDYPGNQVGKYAGILSGMPVQNNRYQQMQAPQPSMMNMMGGGAMGLLGSQMGGWQ